FTATEFADPTISGDGADPDGDGQANLVEYSLGLDPKSVDRDRRPTAAVQTIIGQPYLTLKFRRLLLAHEVAYTVELSDDLANLRATAQPVGSPVLGDDGYLTTTYRDESPISNATGARYLRVRVTLLPR